MANLGNMVLDRRGIDSEDRSTAVPTHWLTGERIDDPVSQQIDELLTSASNDPDAYRDEHGRPPDTKQEIGNALKLQLGAEGHAKLASLSQQRSKSTWENWRKRLALGQSEDVSLDLNAEKLAASCFESSANSGCLAGIRGLAKCYWEGHGVESDLTRAESLYRTAAAAGNLDDKRALMLFLDRVNRGSEFKQLRDQVAQMEKTRDSRAQWTELQRISH